MSFVYKEPDGYFCTRCNRGLDPEETHLSYDGVLTCKRCGSENVISAFKCDICREFVPEDEIVGCEHRVCWSCIEKKRYDLDFCTKVGETEGSECCLNSFLASFFTESEINDLMMEALKERANISPVDGLKYLDYQSAAAGDILYDEERR